MKARRWPVLRRDAEFEAVRSALGGDRGPRGIVLFGDMGVGKTTLARSVTESLSTPVDWVAGTESARAVPLGVFPHLVGPTVSRDPVAALAAARETIRAERYSIIGVDDAHLLDHLSATLLHQLTLAGAVRMVATVRTGEPVPDAITSLWKDGYLQRLPLAPFTRSQCTELVEDALDGRVEGLSADLMWQASGGNALFIRHLVEGALQAGSLRQVRGVWQLRGNTAVTAELVALLDARIEQLPDDEIHVLQLLAFAEPLALDVLSAMVGVGVIEHVERHGLVRIVEGQPDLTVEFTHPLYGEVIRRGLGRVATRRLKGELYRAIQTRPARDVTEHIRLAKLALDSDVLPDIDLFIAAARDAVALTDVGLGECLAGAAVRHGGGLVASELLARSLLWQGRALESEHILTSFDPQEMSDLDLVRWGTARIANLRWSLGDARRANEVLALMQNRIQHPGLQLLVDGISSVTQMFEDQLDKAAAASRRVLDNPDASPSAVEWAAFGGALAAALTGRTDDAAEIAAHGRRVRDRVGGLLRYLIGFGEVRALTLAGDFDAAERRSTDMVRSSPPGQYVAWGLANILVGTVEVARGRFTAAIPRMEETIAALPIGPAASWSLPAGLLLAMSYSALGRTDAAAATTDELRTGVGRHVAVFEPQLRLAEAWLAAAQGHVTGAIDRALGAADLARLSGQRAVEMLALHDAARFGDRSSLQRLVDVARSIGGRLAQTHARYAIALQTSNASELRSTAEQFEVIGALLYAADAAAQAAQLFTSSGDRRHGMEAAAAADRLAEACGGVHTPALELASHPLPLSPREREIANFVARGWSNRDIAERLVVSTRTVEGHIYHACVKLDVSDREGLAVAVRHSPAG